MYVVHDERRNPIGFCLWVKVTVNFGPKCVGVPDFAELYDITALHMYILLTLDNQHSNVSSLVGH